VDVAVELEAALAVVVVVSKGLESSASAVSAGSPPSRPLVVAWALS